MFTEWRPGIILSKDLLVLFDEGLSCLGDRFLGIQFILTKYASN